MKKHKRSQEPPRNTNFLDNKGVEALVTQYVKGGCVDVELRNQIMSHVPKFLKGVIRNFNFDNLSYVKDPHRFEELVQVAWQQIEKTLYKFDYSEGHSKLFSQWTQVAKQKLLAELKLDNRDIKNYKTLKAHKLYDKPTFMPVDLSRFFGEAREMFQYDEINTEITNHLEHLVLNNDMPYDGMIGKLVKSTGYPRTWITKYFKEIRLRAYEFTDSPFNRIKDELGCDDRENLHYDESDGINGE